MDIVRNKKMLKFNIKQELDIDKLNHNLTEFKKVYQDPIIIMSFDTLNSFPKMPDQDYLIEQCKKNHFYSGMVGKYYGSRVFVDPSLNFGDIELR